MLEQIVAFCRRNIFSCNFLYVDPVWQPLAEAAGCATWINQQSLWPNPGYDDFDYLGASMPTSAATSSGSASRRQGWSHGDAADGCGDPPADGGADARLLCPALQSLGAMGQQVPHRVLLHGGC